MRYNDMKLAFRHLWRRKMYTIIILLSLAIGFVCSNLLISFLIAETNTDSFHINKERTYQLFSSDPFGGKGNIAYIPAFMGDYLYDNYPGIESICQMSDLKGVSLVTDAGESHNMVILSSDSSFFSLFNFPLYNGSADHAFGPDRIILSREKAQMLFGQTDVVNQTLTLKMSDTTRLLTVSAIINETPENSHLVFDAIVHHSVLQNRWQGGASYVLLNTGENNKNLEEKINEDDQRPGLIGPGKVDYFLTPLSDSYFNGSNRMAYMKTRSATFIWISSIVCGLVLFMASFNFINLFLLSLQGRKKETGVKKILGISIQQLIKASLIEVSLYILIAFGLSLLLSYMILPWFNTVLETNLTFEYLFRPEVLLVISVIVLVFGIIVVVIATVQQWKTQAISLVRNAASSKIAFNRSLFTVQFIIAITLAICSITIIKQMRFIKHEPLGFNRNIIQMQAPDKTVVSKLSVLKQNLLQISGIDRVAIASGNPISGNAVVRYELDNAGFYTPFLFSGDEDFVKTLKLTLLEGELPSAGKEGKLVNETLVRQFNMDNPIGEKVPGTEDRIIGVVKDFTCVSFKEEVPPVIISYEHNTHRMLIDYGDSEIPVLIPQIQKAWSKVFPEHVFTYQIIQQALLKKYKEDTFFFKTVVAFSIISMVISCFGLFALSWAVIQSRTKEIGIRKVLGATAQDILSLLMITFIKPIFFAFIIAVPVGFVLMERWLEIFVNKISLNIWIFVFAALFVIVTAVATVGLQTIKAAVSNPIDELKTE